MSSLPLAAMAQPRGFHSDPRFGGSIAAPLKAAEEPADPLALAWADGHAAGRREALTEAAAQAARDDAARARIELAFMRQDAEWEEQLRQRLFATVETLCTAAIAPLALDTAALAERVKRAAAMLARADDERLLRLHPDDIAMLGTRLPAGLAVLADPLLERGAIHVETTNGGVEDGPDHWRRAIAEALAQ